MTSCFLPQHFQEFGTMQAGSCALIHSMVQSFGNTIMFGGIMHSEYLLNTLQLKELTECSAHIQQSCCVSTQATNFLKATNISDFARGKYNCAASVALSMNAT